MRKLLLLTMTLILLFSCKSAPDADEAPNTQNNSSSTTNEPSPNNTSSDTGKSAMNRITNRKDLPNPKISQEVIAFDPPIHQNLDYGIMYYLIEAPHLPSPTLPLGEFNDTIHQFEQTITNSGLFIFPVSRRVFSYQNNNEVFVIDFQKGEVVQDVNGIERMLLPIRRATGSDDFTQWRLYDPDIKALNLQLKQLDLDQLSQGQTIKIHFIIRSSSTTQVQSHFISQVATFSYTIK